MKIGIIGCGNISNVYIRNCQGFRSTEVAALADLVPERARAKAKQHGVPRACSPEELLGDPEIEAVLNLTIPKAHAEVTLAALEAGKHAYSEKPLATRREDAARIAAASRARGLRVGAAPDTFLGAGLQTCRQLIDEDAIGMPVACTAFMLCHGHESWHPDPAFYYQQGGGPLFDMGPYYLTALVSLLGPVKRVAASAHVSFPERTITSEPKRGEKILVETPTHIAGVLDFACGAVGTLVTSFDVWHAEVPRIEIYGTEGTLSVPDPNGFGGPVRIRRAGEAEWTEVPITRPYAENSRGIGLADMAEAIAGRRPHRASLELASHLLDVMAGFLDSSAVGRHYVPVTTCRRPDALPADAAF